MAAKRAGVQVVLRPVEGKTKKVTVSLPPALADKLRLAACGLGLDQGDVVAAGLAVVLSGVEVRVRLLGAEPGVRPSAESDAGDVVGADGEGQALRIA